MAKRVITQTVFEDDLTGNEVAEEDLETIRFTVDGSQYEIDLSTESAERFRESMGQWTKVARRIGGKKGTKKAAAAPRTNSEHSAAEIRDWARTNNIDVTERGRVPDAVREQFELAHAS